MSQLMDLLFATLYKATEMLVTNCNLTDVTSRMVYWMLQSVRSWKEGWFFSGLCCLCLALKSLKHWALFAEEQECLVAFWVPCLKVAAVRISGLFFFFFLKKDVKGVFKMLTVSFLWRTLFFFQMGKWDVLPWDCNLGWCWEPAAGESGSTACHCLSFLLLLPITGAVGSPGPEQGEEEEEEKKEPSSQPNPGKTAPERGGSGASFRLGSCTAQLVRGQWAKEKGAKNGCWGNGF